MMHFALALKLYTRFSTIYLSRYYEKLGAKQHCILTELRSNAATANPFSTRFARISNIENIPESEQILGG